MKTLYDILGVDRRATRAEIEASYLHSLNAHIAARQRRTLRKREDARLRRMREAYLLLTSPTRRLNYDLRLDEAERLHARVVQRAASLGGAVLLVAGLVLIAQGFHRFRQEDASRTGAHAELVEATKAVAPGPTALASPDTLEEKPVDVVRQ